MNFQLWVSLPESATNTTPAYTYHLSRRDFEIMRGGDHASFLENFDDVAQRVGD
jgi:redox-sensitive bicupin YhaK (pirin superfamily)